MKDQMTHAEAVSVIVELEEENLALRAALMMSNCPRPINNAEHDSTVWCCQNGHCGCGRNHLLGIEKGHGYAVPNAKYAS